MAARSTYSRIDYEGAAIVTTLASQLAAAATSASITAATGWPDGSAGHFFVVVKNSDGDVLEKIDVTSRSGTTLTLGARGVDGTSDSTHAAGLSIHPVFTAVEADEANYTVAETVGKITAAGEILVGDGAKSLAALDAKGSAKILQGNGTTLVSNTVTGDVTINASGVTAIGASKVTNAMMADDAVGAAELTDIGPGATGPYGSGTTVPVVTIDAQGRVTGFTSTSITGAPPSGAASGNVLEGTFPSPGLNAAVAGAGLTESSDVLAVGAGSGITVNANDVAVNPGTGLENSGGAVRLAAAAAGNGLTGGAGSALAVGAGTGITVAADSVAVTTGGITAALLQSGLIPTVGKTTIAADASVATGDTVATHTITDPGYNIEVWGHAILGGYASVTLAVWYMEIYVDGVVIGTLGAPFFSTTDEMCVGVPINHTAHTTGTNCVVTIKMVRALGDTGTFTITDWTSAQAVHSKMEVWYRRAV